MEIGRVLHPLYRGNGYASRLTELLIEKGLRSHKQPVIECVPGQEVTRHLAMKYGIEYDGRTGGFLLKYFCQQILFFFRTYIAIRS